MALIQCPECKEQVSNSAQSCPHCGFPIAEHWRKQAAQKQQQVREEKKRLRKKREREKQLQYAKYILIAFGLSLPCLCSGIIWSSCEKKEQEQAAKEQKAKQAKQRRAKLEKIRKNLDKHIEKVRKIAEGNKFVVARRKLAEMKKAAPKDKRLAELEKELEEQAGAYQAKLSLKSGKELHEKGESHRKEREWVEAEKAYVSGLAELDKVDENHMSDEHKKLHKKLERGKKRVAKRAAKVRKERAERQAEERAYRTLCGKKPRISPWDGSVLAVENYLERAAHDPESIEFQGCTEPFLTNDDCWRTTCVFRGANAFGAQIRQKKTFFIRAHSEIEDLGVVHKVD